MLVLFETSAGYALFKMLDESKLKKVEVISEEFSSAEKAQENLQLVSFKKFKDVDDAVKNISSMQEGTLSTALKKMLKSKVMEEGNLVVGDSKISNLIKERLEGIKCVHNSATAELMRGIRCHVDVLLADYATELKAMRLALAHALGRYKVKFNPEKIDTMITQAVLLLDDLDKELNNYVMRCREWYGWHFPELSKIVQDPIAYVKTIKAIGKKQNSIKVDLSSILTEDLIARVNQEAEMSMGSNISDLDILLISELCDQIIEVSVYRTQLNEYLKNRMHALAPNVTVLLGELVGARLISKAGSLVGLAKCPSSTVQLLGAEKALFRALKTKKDTPKYGIIYHAQLISQASTNLKGKVARKLAAKVSLAARIDALREESSGNEMGIESRAYLEAVMKLEMERGPKRFSGVGQAPSASYTFKKEVYDYDASQDFTLKKEDETPMGKKRKLIEVVSSEEVDASEKPSKKPKLVKDEDVEKPRPTELEMGDNEEEQISKKIKKKLKKTPRGKQAAGVKKGDTSD